MTGRGRATRGRGARGTEAQPQAQRPGAQQQPAAPRPAWGPSARAPEQPGRPASSQGAIPKVPIGRVTQRTETGPHDRPGTAISQEGVVAGAGEGATSRTAGLAMRGKKQPSYTQFHSKPAGMLSKKGTTGKPICLSANYFKVAKAANWTLYQYRVDFAPEEDRTSEKKKLMRIAMANTLNVYLFDGTVLYSIARLSEDPKELFVEGEGADRVRITLRLVGDVKRGDNHYMAIFNHTVRKCLNMLRLQLIGRNYFDPKSKIKIPEHKMEVWPGYITSVRQHEDDILLGLEITSKVMRMDTVLNLLHDCYNEDKANYKKLFMSRVIGCVVLTDYNNRTYRVDDIDWETTPQSKFTRSDGSSISYMDYYRTRYQLNIRDAKQPMIISKAKPREIRAGMAETVNLIPELCRMTGLTDAQRANFQLMRALADHTRIAPANRIERLHQFSQRLLNIPEVLNEFKTWDLQFTNRIIEFNGRLLPPEKILFGNKQSFAGSMNADWTGELRKHEMFFAPRINYWAVIYPNRLSKQVESFVNLLQKAAGGMRWNLPRPEKFEINDDRPATYLPTLDNVIHGPRGEPNLIMCVVSNNKADRYSAIKKKCTVDKAVPTQVIVARNLDSKGVMSIATKVAVQMNCKIGGAPWSVEMPLNGLMVVGYDVCHDTQNKSISYGAMVATLDRYCTKYYSVTAPHKSGEELNNYFAVFLIQACKTYQKENGKLPDRIIIYRDGVGDGQIPYVKETEIEHVRKELINSLYPEENFRFAFIVVTKRINTRLFASGQNPSPGTVVDDVITQPERYDFFIVSQCVRQGTVSPTSYNVLYDTFGLQPDQIQRLTYKLCHMYYNWSGTVRVPAPCQYAHKLAFLVAQHLHRSPNQNLNSVLYYL